MVQRKKRCVAVIGLGYVGLPVAVAFANAQFDVVGFDIDKGRIKELQSGYDRTMECTSEQLASASLSMTASVEDLANSDFYIITVPTPIDSANRPDMSALMSASKTVGSVLKRGDIVVYESTVYPGATEDDCVPVLESTSGLNFGKDFTVGYSPERINPGDKVHRFETIKKVVSGSDEPTEKIIAETYRAVVTAGIHIAPSIKVAEAAKVIENTQRDINIGFVNELSLIFNKLEIDTSDVLDAASTKWNFLNFRPGLVGGHCIGVDPYYLTYQSERFGHHAEVILSGRRVNDGMGERIARECIRLMLKSGKSNKGNLTATILGFTFKEDVPDVRNTRVIDIAQELASFGIQVQVYDPIAEKNAAEHEYGLKLMDRKELRAADAIILAVQHRAFASEGWKLVHSLLSDGGGVVLDVKCALDRSQKPENVTLWRP